MATDIVDYAEYYNTFGENFRGFVKSSGKTQVEIAAELGVKYNTLNNWYNGTSAPRPSMLPVVAEYFHCYVEQLTTKDFEVSNIQLLEQTTHDFNNNQWEMLLDYANYLRLNKKGE